MADTPFHIQGDDIIAMTTFSDRNMWIAVAIQQGTTSNHGKLPYFDKLCKSQFPTNVSVSIFRPMIFIEEYFIYMLVTYTTDNKNTEATTVDISAPGDKYD